jgi:hypothetical protein
MALPLWPATGQVDEVKRVGPTPIALCRLF